MLAAKSSRGGGEPRVESTVDVFSLSFFRPEMGGGLKNVMCVRVEGVFSLFVVGSLFRGFASTGANDLDTEMGKLKEWISTAETGSAELGLKERYVKSDWIGRAKISRSGAYNPCKIISSKPLT